MTAGKRWWWVQAGRGRGEGLLRRMGVVYVADGQQVCQAVADALMT